AAAAGTTKQQNISFLMTPENKKNTSSDSHWLGLGHVTILDLIVVCDWPGLVMCLLLEPGVREIHAAVPLGWRVEGTPRGAGGERRLGGSSAMAFPIRTPILPDQGPTRDLTCHLRGGPISTDSPTGASTPTFPMTCLPPFSASLSASAPGLPIFAQPRTGSLPCSANC
ncbi:hypothetical protein H1C71_005633, partial [Ictidomys tridecemlineatus]